MDNEEDLLRYSSLAMISFSAIAFLLEIAGINVFFHHLTSPDLLLSGPLRSLCEFQWQGMGSEDPCKDCMDYYGVPNTHCDGFVCLCLWNERVLPESSKPIPHLTFYDSLLQSCSHLSLPHVSRSTYAYRCLFNRMALCHLEQFHSSHRIDSR